MKYIIIFGFAYLFFHNIEFDDPEIIEVYGPNKVIENSVIINFDEEEPFDLSDFYQTHLKNLKKGKKTFIRFEYKSSIKLVNFYIPQFYDGCIKERNVFRISKGNIYTYDGKKSMTELKPLLIQNLLNFDVHYNLSYHPNRLLIVIEPDEQNSLMLKFIVEKLTEGHNELHISNPLIINIANPEELNYKYLKCTEANGY